MKAIEITNLNKYYGDFHAIKDVTMEVEQGEIYGFVGPNGAGEIYLNQKYTRIAQNDFRFSKYPRN